MKWFIGGLIIGLLILEWKALGGCGATAFYSRGAAAGAAGAGKGGCGCGRSTAANAGPIGAPAKGRPVLGSPSRSMPAPTPRTNIGPVAPYIPPVISSSPSPTGRGQIPIYGNRVTPVTGAVTNVY